MYITILRIVYNYNLPNCNSVTQQGTQGSQQQTHQTLEKIFKNKHNCTLFIEAFNYLTIYH